MAEYFLSIDDTDNLESPGTGHVLEAIGVVLAQKGLGLQSRITRHQLFVHPDVPFTSHNSAMCTILTDVGDEDGLIRTVEEELSARAADGSDPGVCVVRRDSVRNPDLLMDYGHRAKSELLDKTIALGIAGECGLYLKELGGTGDGIIGALAGVALRLDGNDGRYRGRLTISGLDVGNQTAGRPRVSVSHLLATKGIDAVRDVETGDAIAGNDKVQMPAPPEVKTVLLNGLSVLPLRRTGDSWRCLDRTEIKGEYP